MIKIKINLKYIQNFLSLEHFKWSKTNTYISISSFFFESTIGNFIKKKNVQKKVQVYICAAFNGFAYNLEIPNAQKSAFTQFLKPRSRLQRDNLSRLKLVNNCFKTRIKAEILDHLWTRLYTIFGRDFSSREKVDF